MPSLSPSTSYANRWRDVVILVVLLLLPFVLFAPVAAVQATFFIHDVQHYFYPYHFVSAQAVAQGELPLWNPYAFSGIPLLGDGQTAMFYPPNWLFFALPGPAALNYAVLLEWSIAGASTFLCARSFHMWRVPAMIAALSFMFCGFLTARVLHLSIMSGAALLPLVLLCVDGVLRRGTVRWFVAAAGAVALQAVAGHPQVPVYSALAVGIYALVLAAHAPDVNRWRTALRLLVRLAGVYVLGYCIAAIQLVPWVELAAQSPRAAGASFDFVFGGSMAGSNWLLFLFPYLYGSLEPSIYANQAMSIARGVQTWEHSAYVGILPLALAVVALAGLWRPSRDAAPTTEQRFRSTALRFFGVLLLLGLLMAAGRYTPFAYVIYVLPVIGKLRDVERVIVLAAFALAMLAGFGWQRLAEADAPHRRSAVFAAALIVLLPLLGIGLAASPLASADMALLHLNRPNAFVPLLFAIASAGLLVWLAWHRAGPRIGGLAVALVALDMCSYAAMFNPTTSPLLYSYQPGSVAFLRQDPGPYRVATFIADNAPPNPAAQEQLAVSWGMVYGIETINGFNSLQPRRYTDYLFSPDVGDVSYGYLNDPRLFQANNQILSSLNTKYLIVPNNDSPQLGSNFRQVYANADVRIYQNDAVYPRAFFPDTVVSTNNPRTVLDTVTAAGFDGQRTALVEGRPPPLPQPLGQATVAVTSMAATSMTLATNTSEDRLLMLSDMYFTGWHAYVDNAETPIYRANYLFRSVVVPPGEHTVTFVYRPLSALVGAIITAAALLFSLVLAWRGRWRWR